MYVHADNSSLLLILLSKVLKSTVSRGSNKYKIQCLSQLLASLPLFSPLHILHLFLTPIIYPTASHPCKPQYQISLVSIIFVQIQNTETSIPQSGPQFLVSLPSISPEHILHLFLNSISFAFQTSSWIIYFQ